MKALRALLVVVCCCSVVSGQGVPPPVTDSGPGQETFPVVASGSVELFGNDDSGFVELENTAMTTTLVAISPQDNTPQLRSRTSEYQGSALDPNTTYEYVLLRKARDTDASSQRAEEDWFRLSLGNSTFVATTHAGGMREGDHYYAGEFTTDSQGRFSFDVEGYSKGTNASAKPQFRWFWVYTDEALDPAIVTDHSDGSGNGGGDSGGGDQGGGGAGDPPSDPPPPDDPPQDPPPGDDPPPPGPIGDTNLTCLDNAIDQIETAFDSKGFDFLNDLSSGGQDNAVMEFVIPIPDGTEYSVSLGSLDNNGAPSALEDRFDWLRKWVRATTGIFFGVGAGLFVLKVMRQY